jgi:predicted O-methyltransferase YrrM
MPTPETVRQVRERLVTRGAVDGPDGRSRSLFPVAIGRGEGSALRDRVIEEGAVRTLETGLAFAVSTLFICEGLLANGTDVMHVAVDPYQMNAPDGRGFGGVGLQTLDDAGIRDLVEFHEQESQIVLPRLLEEGRQVDLAFIDGSHRFEAVFLELVYAARLVKEGGVVFVDDAQLPAVSRAIEFCVGNLQWTTERTGNEGVDHAWREMRTGPRERFGRPFKEFVDFGGPPSR